MTCSSSIPLGNGLGFGTPDNEAVVYGADGTVTPIPRGPKEALADIVWDLVAARMNESVSHGQIAQVQDKLTAVTPGARGEP